MTCEFPILWYFRQSDTYNFLIIIKNDVSQNITVVPVTIYDAATEAQYGLVLIPIASSIVVVVLIISGVALHAHYRNRLAVEVADFDFGQADEEELQYKSFWERLRESFSNHFTSGGSDLVSEGSSVSGRRRWSAPWSSWDRIWEHHITIKERTGLLSGCVGHLLVWWTQSSSPNSTRISLLRSSLDCPLRTNINARVHALHGCDKVLGPVNLRTKV